jgi:hypothetical protein
MTTHDHHTEVTPSPASVNPPTWDSDELSERVVPSARTAEFSGGRSGSGPAED